ncbi:MAG: DUF1186 domain-containing protein, partial [Nanoarchaeota archaeon]
MTTKYNVTENIQSYLEDSGLLFHIKDELEFLNDSLFKKVDIGITVIMELGLFYVYHNNKLIIDIVKEDLIPKLSKSLQEEFKLIYNSKREGYEILEKTKLKNLEEGYQFYIYKIKNIVSGEISNLKTIIYNLENGQIISVRLIHDIGNQMYLKPFGIVLPNDVFLAIEKILNLRQNNTNLSSNNQYTNGELKVQKFLDKKLDVTKSEAQDIIDDKNTTLPLLQVLDDSQIIEPNNFWKLLHATILLSAKKEQKALPLILHILEIDKDAYSDWITEEFASWIFNFGIENLDLFIDFLEDDDNDIFCRLIFSRAMMQFTKYYPETRDKIIKSFNNVLDFGVQYEDDKSFLNMFADDMACVQDERLFEKFKKINYKYDIISKSDWEYIQGAYETGEHFSRMKRDIKNPIEHFNEDNLEYLRNINKPIKKEVH